MLVTILLILLHYVVINFYEYAYGPPNRYNEIGKRSCKANITIVFKLKLSVGEIVESFDVADSTLKLLML